MLSENTVPEFCLAFAEVSLQPVSKISRAKAEDINRPASNANSHTGTLRRHLKELHDCKRILDDSKEEALASEDFTKKFVENESSVSV